MPSIISGAGNRVGRQTAVSIHPPNSIRHYSPCTIHPVIIRAAPVIHLHSVSISTHHPVTIHLPSLHLPPSARYAIHLQYTTRHLPPTISPPSAHPTVTSHASIFQDVAIYHSPIIHSSPKHHPFIRNPSTIHSPSTLHGTRTSIH